VVLLCECPRCSAIRSLRDVKFGEPNAITLDRYVVKMFYLIGLGLGNERDITVKGLEIVKKCARVYLEAYTAILAVDKQALVHSFVIPVCPISLIQDLSLGTWFFVTQEQFYGRPVILADRETVEQGAEDFLNAARSDDIALLVVGDPFGATTHTDLCTRCKHMGVSSLSSRLKSQISPF
jgi:diphthine methyl ester synthase